MGMSYAIRFAIFASMNDQNFKDPFPKSNAFDKFRLAGLSKLLMGILSVDRIHKICLEHNNRSILEITERIISEMQLETRLSELDVKHIPKEGAAIIVANHPLGGVDGLLMLKTIIPIRSDVKILANFRLPSDDALRSHFIPVDPYSENLDFEMSTRGTTDAERHLEAGGILCVFPSGKVSSYNLRPRAIRDREWQLSALSLIKSSQVPVIPVNFTGQFRILFHLLTWVNPLLKQAKLPAELFNKNGNKISIRIGRPVPVKEQEEFMDIYEYGRYLRTRSYLLGKSISVKPFFRPALFKKKVKEIAPELNHQAILKEIEALKKADSMLYENKEFQVFWAAADTIPHLLYEIGRLREITFRDVGEGTGKTIDLDEFDLYYRHLFIWDMEQECIAGAYRLGMGKEILQRYGKRGFYLYSLFKLRNGFLPVLEESVELGRSFVVKSYQQKPLPLYLLWKGILYFILKNPDYRYLIGPVSISGEFSKYSKFLIINFIREYYFDKELAQLVRPRMEYIPEFVTAETDVDALKKITGEDLKKLDKLIEEIELGNFRLPPLLKKYLGQNAKIIAFNVDPKFNNSLDGLLVMDMFNVPFETIDGLAKELNDKSILDNFPGRK